MESGKIKEIKKALECCATGRCSSSCPLFYEEPINCQDKLNIDVLSYVNELESENERLQSENRVLLGKENIQKNEALEVFANKLKEKAIKLAWQGLGTTDIDETLKEFMRNGQTYGSR